MAAFFDTSLLGYCTDTTTPAKQSRARSLVAQFAASGEAVLSTQVLVELCHVLTRKQKMPATTAQALIQAYSAWPVIDSDVALVKAAIEKSIRHRLPIWDAMVIEAALRAEAQTLFTEDLTHGLRFGAMTVVNPFIA